MTKKELVEAIQKKMELPTFAAAEKVYNGITEVYCELAETTPEKESIPFGKMGSFKKMKRAGRVGRNPATGEEIKIPETTVVTFKMSSETKAKLKA